MHQQSRHPPRISSPASSPQTNPARTNNPRDRIRSGSDAASHDGGRSDSAESFGSGPSRDSIKKLDQIVQNFYYKVAVVILQSRLNTTPVGNGKKNRWFSIDTDDIEDFAAELGVFKQSGSFENRPPPLIIETYIDASRLNSSQSLVIVDDNGKRWDVLEALNSSDTSDDSPQRRHAQKRNAEVILERWRLELKCLPGPVRDEFGPTLPTVYKRSIVFFRSLFLAARMMPCFKYSQQALAKGIHPALEVRCRVRSADPEYATYDPLRQPLHDGQDAVTEYVFADLEVPVGRFYASVTYRNDCNFRVEDAESLLSSRLLGLDENYFKPSISQRRDHDRYEPYVEPGSLPSHRQDRGRQGPQQTYGSLSTFHGAGALGTSPITALRSVRPIGSDTSSPPESMSESVEPTEPPHSLPIRGAAGRPASRAYDGSNRRPSVSFQPFKAGSLSGSPRIPDLEPPSSPKSLTRPSTTGPTRAGNRSSLTMGSAASLRGAPPLAPVPQDAPSLSGSPRPGSRYSSSFTHRRNRPSFGGQSGQSGQSKPDDDQASSGKQSLSSSAQPGSGLLTEAAATSSGSFAADDDNISDFLKALDNRKTLKSFEVNKKGESLASKRTAAQLSKFQQMREANTLLTESMTSSIHLHRSSSSSSRQLANVPSMVNPASMSISSSPGKPLSPHTPHTPAIPSRLSENSIIDYQPPQPRQGRPNLEPSPGEQAEHDEHAEDDDDNTPVVTQQDTGTTGTTAIDIPLSPRLLHHGHPHSAAAIRRPNSVAQTQQQQQSQSQQQPQQQQQPHRSLASEVERVPYLQRHHQRSASVEPSAAADDTADLPTLSTLLGYQREDGSRRDVGNANNNGSSNTSGGGGIPIIAGGIDSDTDSGARVSVERRGPPSAGPGLGLGMGLGMGSTSVGLRRPSLGSSGGSGSGSVGGAALRAGGGIYRPASASGIASSGGGGGANLSGATLSGGVGSGRGRGSGSGGRRYAGSVDGAADEEPLLFAMSELERESTRRGSDEGGAQMSLQGRLLGHGSGNGSGRGLERGTGLSQGRGSALGQGQGRVRGGGFGGGDHGSEEEEHGRRGEDASGGDGPYDTPRGVLRKGW
ncbi:autophagy-related protein 13-domain-containing protein [Chaetomium sp. MPI-SDFR-AT-0129]|nr:autophagy-related protein 13-domain-containing protein [Chaetomium sp. MPI-SDFR-AT-0129]